MFIDVTCSRSVAPRSTFYKAVTRTTSSSRDALKLRLGQAGSILAIALHWLDNFARTFARQGIYLDREMFVSMLWTAHGVKTWPGPCAVTMSYTHEGD